jgi:hypothetical protein
MTRIGEFLSKKSVNRASVSRKTGIGKTRLNELSNNLTTKLRADELYLIALATGTKPADLLDFVCGHLQLAEDTTKDGRRKT